MFDEAVIVSGGSFTDAEFYRKILQNKYIICADGGIHLLQKLNIKPNVFLGDFDSCNFEKIENDGFLSACEDIKRFKVEKNATDTHIAVDYAIEKGFCNITIICALGGRCDHSLANIMLLKYMLKKGINAKIANEKNTIFLTDKSVSVNPQAGRHISLIALSETVSGLTLKNLKYPLSNFTLEMGNSIGVSNEFGTECAEIVFDKGLLAVITSED